MENHGGMLTDSTLSSVAGFGTTWDSFLAGSLLDNADFKALFSTLKTSGARDSFSSQLAHLGLLEKETFFANQNSENSPLVGSFSSDSLASTLLENQTTPLPDLSGEFSKVKLPETTAPDKQGQVKLVVTNQGDLQATGPLEINLFASTDAILDANDQLLNSLERPKFKLSSNLSKTYIIDFTNPQGVAPGAYYLLANIDVDNAIAESNENNLVNTRVSAKGTDVVLDWNATLLNAIATDKTAPPVAARNMAMVHTGIYAAVSIIDKLRSDYSDYLDAVAPEGVSRKAAAATAAHHLLVDLYPNPTQTATFDIQLGLSLAEVPDGEAENYGIALGQFVAELVSGWRSTDGSSNIVSYTPGTEPGDWQPTPPGLLPALLPQWSSVSPFGINSGSQFRPDGPPALDSAEYTVEFNQVKELGNLNSTTRTAEQTEIAQFWADGPGTFTPPGHWNQIAERVSLAQGNTLSENARLFALLNIAEADAGIVAWDAKYEYNFWRPVTAIQQADTDGNPNTIADPSWTPLLVTPPFPEYISGHSTFSGAADSVLTSFFGDISFTTNSIGLPGVIRSFDSFTEAADEAGISRIYGGIHFQSANADGLAAGRALGQYVF